MGKDKRLRRKQLDGFFVGLKALNLSRPKKGWVREVREALGMSMQDLASRMGAIKQLVDQIEKNELTGKVTLTSLQKTADAMNCDFVYFLVPRTNLEATIDFQAQKIAEEILSDVNNTMKLENQALSIKAQKEAVEKLKKKILLDNFNTIWKVK